MFPCQTERIFATEYIFAIFMQVEALLSASHVRYDMLVAESEDRLQLMMQTVEKMELENSYLRSRLDEEKK